MNTIRSPPFVRTPFQIIIYMVAFIFPQIVVSNWGLGVTGRCVGKLKVCDTKLGLFYYQSNAIGGEGCLTKQ